MVSHGGTDALGLFPMVGIEVGLVCAPLHHHVWRVRDERQSFSTGASSEKADMVKHLGGGFVAKAGQDGVHASPRVRRSIDELLAASAESLPAPEAGWHFATARVNYSVMLDHCIYSSDLAHWGLW